MNIESWIPYEALGTCITAVVTGVAAYLSLRLMRRQIKSSEDAVEQMVEQTKALKENAQRQVQASYLAKQPDVLMLMTPRFDQLYGALPRKGSHDPKDEMFRKVRAYWSLQLEDYRLYLRGFIDDAAFKYFMILRYREHEGNEFENFKKLTAEALEDFKDADFQEFMEYVFKYGNDIDRVMTEAKERRKKHLGTELARILQLD